MLKDRKPKISKEDTDLQEGLYTRQELHDVNDMIEVEQTHKQWKKHGICMVLLVSQIAINLLRSASFSPIEKCSVWDWMLFILYLIICAIVTVVSTRLVMKEQALKEKVGKGLIASDIRFKGKVIRSLVLFSFMGGWVSGALGLGGGAIFNPLLLSMGVPPSVASATGMYLILYSTSSSSISYIA